MLQRGLEAEGVAVARVAPVAPPLPAAGYAALQRARIDLRTFLMNYPVWADYPPADVYHLTSQNLATALLFRRPPGRVIVTVHDIIPYMLRDDPALSTYRGRVDRLFDHLAMRGLRRADQLIADSHYTKRCLTKHLGIAPERISVVHLGIDHERYRPAPAPAALSTRYGLRHDRRYLIYVGSEDPRKNVATLVRALAALRQTHPDVELLKVGRAHFAAERRKLVGLAAFLGVGAAIHWLDDVPEADLPGLYSLASVCVMPSRYEGFGFPVLEAMACGTPVVAADASSLPELVGDGGVLASLHAPDGTAFTDVLNNLLSDRAVYEDVRARGLARAAQFTWRSTTQAVRAVYAAGG